VILSKWVVVSTGFPLNTLTGGARLGTPAGTSSHCRGGAHAEKATEKAKGITGSARFGGPAPAEFVRAELPDDQQEIERLAVERALRDGPKSGCDLNAFYGLRRPPQPKPPPGHDFDLDTVTGPQSLELMTVAKGPFERARLAFARGDRIADLLRDVVAKSVHYGGVPRKDLHLLVYSTDFRFHLHGDDIRLLAFDLARTPHVFGSVVYYEFADEQGQDEGHVHIVFPPPDRLLDGFDHAVARTQQVALADLPNLTAVPGGFEVKLGPLTKPVPGPGVLRIRMRSEPRADGEQPPDRHES